MRVFHVNFPALLLLLSITAKLYAVGRYGPDTGRNCSTDMRDKGRVKVDCTFRDFTVVPKSSNWRMAVSLLLNSNRIQRLYDDDFISYARLAMLYLRQNEIWTIANETFRGLTNLVVLDLSYNRLRSIPTSSFQYISGLKELYLMGNELQTIEPQSFIYLPSLRLLDLEKTSLVDVSRFAFQGLGQLKELALPHNQLSSLQFGAFQPFQDSLRVLRIYENPWHCDCRLRWLKLLLEQKEVSWQFGSRSPECAWPERSKSLNFGLIGATHFSCPPSNDLYGLKVDNSLQVNCIAFGDPRPHIRWTKDDLPLSDGIAIDTKFSIVNTFLNYTSQQSVLTIKNVSFERDYGRYVCIAENYAGEAVKVYNIPVPASDSAAASGESSWSLPISEASVIVAGISLLVFFTSIFMVSCLLFRSWRRRRRRHTMRPNDAKRLIFGSSSNSDESPTNAADNHNVQKLDVLRNNNGKLVAITSGVYEASTLPQKQSAGRYSVLSGTNNVQPLGDNDEEDDRATVGMLEYYLDDVTNRSTSLPPPSIAAAAVTDSLLLSEDLDEQLHRTSTRRRDSALTYVSFYQPYAMANSTPPPTNNSLLRRTARATTPGQPRPEAIPQISLPEDYNIVNDDSSDVDRFTPLTRDTTRSLYGAATQLPSRTRPQQPSQRRWSREPDKPPRSQTLHRMPPSAADLIERQNWCQWRPRSGESQEDGPNSAVVRAQISPARETDIDGDLTSTSGISPDIGVCQAKTRSVTNGTEQVTGTSFKTVNETNSSPRWPNNNNNNGRSSQLSSFGNSAALPPIYAMPRPVTSSSLVGVSRNDTSL